LLEQYGIAVPRGMLASSAEQAGEAVARFGGQAMLKAQVLTGGRGKAGAVRAVYSEQEAESTAARILAMTLKGFPVKKILVTEIWEILAEFYAAVTIDRDSKEIILIISAAGGMDVEESIQEKPELVKKFVLLGATGEAGKERLSRWLSLSFGEVKVCDEAAEIIWNMYRLFTDMDCSLVEINPLAITARGLVAADAKIVLDENAVPLHPELTGLRNAEGYTCDELRARIAGLSFVSLSGEIGCIVNGAGLAMATMDGIKLAGGNAANFLDLGGGSNPAKVLKGLRILLRNDQLRVILINIFGGITRCDDIAKGIIVARQQLGITLPMVIRLIGTNDVLARKMLRDAGLIAGRNMSDAIRDAVNHASAGVQR
jgi:succinyl-CoA synthetase beta subunit